MTFSNHNSFKAALEQLKEVLSRSHGDSEESARLIQQIAQLEAIITDIDNKIGSKNIPSTTVNAQSVVIPPPQGAVISI